MVQHFRRWYALFVPIVAIAVLLAALIPGSASAASTGTVQGVISAGGAGLNGVNVDLYDASGQDTGYSATTATVAGVDGTYTIDNVPTGTYYAFIDPSAETNSNGVYYLADWYGATAGAPNSQQESSAEAIQVASGGTDTVSATVVTGVQITGTVTDATTTHDLTDGVVAVYDAQGNEVVTGPNGGDGYVTTPLSSTGTFTLSGLPSGTYFLQIEGTNTAPTTYDEYKSGSSAVDDAWAYDGSGGLTASVQAGTGFALTAGAASPSTENVALPAATAVSGTTSTGGNPEGNVNVYLLDSSGNPTLFSGYSMDITSADWGDYAIDHVLPGSYKVQFQPGDIVGVADTPSAETSGNLAFQFWQNAPTVAAATTISPTATNPLTTIDATLVAGGQITGTVTSAATGKPLADTSVALLDASGDVEETATSQSDGTYTLNGIPAGSWYVEFAPGGASATQYQAQYDGDSQTLGSATPIAVSAAATTANVNAALASANAPSKTTTVETTTTVAASIPSVAGPKPTISGTVKVGDTLAARTGTWTTGTTFTYQWYAAGKAISGATASTFKLVAADYKKTISLAVVGSESGYYSAGQVSAVTKAVAAGTLKTVTPKISGTASVGHTLTAAHGTWTAGTRFTYQWYANNKKIAAATKSTLKLTSADARKRITVKVTGKLTGYTSVTKTSAGKKVG